MKKSRTPANGVPGPPRCPRGDLVRSPTHQARPLLSGQASKTYSGPGRGGTLRAGPSSASRRTGSAGPRPLFGPPTARLVIGRRACSGHARWALRGRDARRRRCCGPPEPWSAPVVVPLTRRPFPLRKRPSVASGRSPSMALWPATVKSLARVGGEQHWRGRLRRALGQLPAAPGRVVALSGRPEGAACQVPEGVGRSAQQRRTTQAAHQPSPRRPVDADRRGAASASGARRCIPGQQVMSPSGRRSGHDGDLASPAWLTAAVNSTRPSTVACRPPSGRLRRLSSSVVRGCSSSAIRRIRTRWPTSCPQGCGRIQTILCR